MLDTISLERRVFDLHGFIEAFLADPVIREGGTRNQALQRLVIVDRWDAVPMPNHDGTEPLELLEEGRMVFFCMHAPATDDTFEVVGGDPLDADDLDIDIADAYGWTVELVPGGIELHPSLYDGTSGIMPRLLLQATCANVEQAMRGFVTRFMLA